ncbi:MAG: DUF1501 domain-containing protein [Pirellulaceae bacterium]|nr:DUF1501 domain-containing protein [Pirellulaceae bacterium]
MSVTPSRMETWRENLWLSRRDLLRIGSLGIAATALPHLAPGEQLGPAPARAAADSPGRARSVILLWMAGGVTHLDSFDPKPYAPVEVRGVLGDIATRLPGVRFCETLPRLAAIADQLAVIRSYSHDSNDHLLSQVYTLSGRKVDPTGLFTEPNVGSIVNHLQGPRNGLPGYIAVPGITRPGPPPHNLFVGGWLGNQHAPYCLGGLPKEADFTVGEKLANPPSEADEDLRPRSLSVAGSALPRLEQRVRLREQLDGALRQLEQQDQLATVESNYEGALRLLMTPEVRDAFALENEPERVRQAYGRTKLGGRCLMARRLVEAGARFVMVDYGYDSDYGNVWDNHNAPSQNHPPIQQMVFRGYHLAGMDQAFAALVDDLRQRGLLESTLVVFLTEFGRTPQINANGGRDHWGAAGSIFLAGGGVRGGQVVGETDRTASRPLTYPYSPADVAATMYSALGVDPRGTVYDFQHRPRPILDHGSPIREVL